MLEPLLSMLAIGGGVGVYTAALALGIRHGIDWDHIAAITDITSTTAPVNELRESWLVGEPGVMLSDQSHHLQHGHREQRAATAVSGMSVGSPSSAAVLAAPNASQKSMSTAHRKAFWLGTLYALGHGLIVTVLGIIAIVASEFLPDWIDPLMERVVGVTLLILAAYLFYSVYKYFRGGGEFRLRSRWMLIFAGAANAWHWIRSHISEHEHQQVTPQQYGARTAFGIGLIHGIGAETGTQALIIATAVGATSTGVAVVSLMVFVIGLLISNSFVTATSTLGFVSASRRQTVYVAAGLIAAVFSLIVGLAFVTASTGILPGLDAYFRWVGGPDA